MAASVYDSAIYRDLFRDADAAALFSDAAEVRAMLLVEGALAEAQGAAGLIPETAAAAIHRAAREVQIDPSSLAAETGTSAVVVPALVKAFRAAMQAPEHAQYIHWGATSQDIVDTGLVLRLRQVVALYDRRLTATVRALGALAGAHATLPMAGRTWGAAATPSSFGAIAAAWGRPLLRLHARLHALAPDLLSISLSGAAGTLSAMGDRGPDIRAHMARALDLTDPGGSWHAERDRMTAFTGWAADTAASLGKMGEDLSLMTQSGIAEIRLGQSGGSSTMPQKQNPVDPALLVAIARHLAALHAAMSGATIHRQQRDGAAWLTEWLVLPQICLGLARALVVAERMVPGLVPQPDAMARGLDPDGLSLTHAEALSFALATLMPRPEAQAEVKALCLQAMKDGTPLSDLAARRWPDAGLGPVFDAATQMGTAPDEARAFAAAARALPDPG
ncbi:MAG: lyase family protein [Paracoccaceae bacterium]